MIAASVSLGAQSAGLRRKAAPNEPLFCRTFFLQDTFVRGTIGPVDVAALTEHRSPHKPRHFLGFKPNRCHDENADTSEGFFVSAPH
jgi:hypothetical protein